MNDFLLFDYTTSLDMVALPESLWPLSKIAFGLTDAVLQQVKERMVRFNARSKSSYEFKTKERN